MSSPFSTATKSLHEQAIEAIIMATKAAIDNDHQACKMYTQQAEMFAQMIARKMKAMGMHKQAEKYVAALTDHINRVWVIAERSHAEYSRGLVEKAKKAVYKMRKAGDSCKKCKSAVRKDGACNCSFLDKSEILEKGFLNPFSGASPARKEYMATGAVKPTMQVGHVKPDPRYDYKMVHELAPAHQKDIQHKFPGTDHHRYAYPVHRETGELVHGQRIPLPPGHAVRAQAHAFKELKPEHKRGSWVTIDSPGHASHGRGGVVLGPNPNLPGKVGVQIGPSEHHSVWVDPHQVKLGRPTTKVEKAIQTLFNIRKAFFK